VASTNGGREVVNYSSSLSASYELDFWGKNRDAAQAAEETAVANRFDRDVCRTDDADDGCQCLFPGAGRAGPDSTAQSNIASRIRILDAIKQRFSGRDRTDLDVASRKPWLPTSARWCRPLRQTLDQNIQCAATLVSRRRKRCVSSAAR